MRLKIILFFVFLNICAYSQKQKPSIGFIENKGQIIDQKGKQNKDVLYLLNTHGLNVQLKRNGFSYDIYEIIKSPIKEKEVLNPSILSNNLNNIPKYNLKRKNHRIDIDFINSNQNVELITEDKSSDYDNYYNIPNFPNGVTNVYKYKKIKYKNLYNNIDVDFFIPKDTTKAVEYNFVIKPGGKVSDIKMKFNGAKTELIDNKIKMYIRFGQMEETLPLSWIEEDNNKKIASINYSQLNKNTFGFEGDIDVQNKTLIIDPTPTRLWGTYFGGNQNEFTSDIKTDDLLNIYIAGATTSSNNIATSGTYQDYLSGIQNLFFSKFDPSGTIIWGTYFMTESGTNNSQSCKIVVDSNQNLFFTGDELQNSNLATPGAYQETKNAFNDCYLVKLNSNGLRQWGTYYGGNNNDFALSIDIDNNNGVYISGQTFSSDLLPTTNAHQTYLSGQSDAFLAKFDTNGNRLFGTYYGGNGNVEGFTKIQISNDDFLYAMGNQSSTANIATPGSYQDTSNNTGGMIIKFDLNGNRIWGSYICDNSMLKNASINNNSIYITGTTTNQALGTPNTFSPTFLSVSMYSSLYAGTNSFVLNFNLINQNLVWLTYFPEAILGINSNSLNEIYFSGSTGISSNIATTGSFKEIKTGSKDAYLIKLNQLGQRLWGTYYGGNYSEQGVYCNVDNSNNLYLYGITNSYNDISTINSYQENLNGGGTGDNFLVKLKECQTSTIITSNSPICPNKTIELTASGGTNYDWTGPNGFTSSIQNPIINNADALNSGTYSCSITGTGGCDNTVTINVLVGDNTAPIPNNLNLQAITGDCNTIIPTIPTATDNCAGQLNGTTTDPLNYTIPGNYTIYWNYNDGNGNSATQNQSVVITATALPILTATQQFCIQQNATLSNITITGQNIKWYDAQTGGNLLIINTILQNATTYYATQAYNNCESNRVPVSITIYNTPSPTANSNQKFCSTANATLNDIAISGTNVKWYSNQTIITPLAITTPLVNNTTYYASQTLNGCESVNRTPVTINLINTLNANDFSDYLCDDLNNGHEKIVLTSYNSSLISNTTGNTFSFYKSFLGAQNQTPSEKINNENDYQLNVGTSTIYVRIDNVNTCHQIVELNLTLYSKPIIPIAEVTPICQGSNITISAGNFDKYQWSTGETSPSIIVGQAGNYSVTVTENHIGINCSSPKDFKVVNSNIATISQVITNDWTVNNNSITIIVTTSSIGDYEYSLDGNNYQNSNVFTGLNSGEYNIFIRDKNGCGAIKDKTYLLMYPKFFTPNGDGFNDKWKIKFNKNESNLKIKIFDRFGKLLKEFISNSDGWDGTFNGKELPSTDYWFVFIRENGKEYKGHFSLKR
ncbi:T9SS type B sorting domain-containing protein [Flavobacterium sp.]|uniref:DUF7948 domain-containing protein n=1 Tax=Flavobacterium sp. TaxID=239 RepID=UPI003750CED3